MAPGTPPPPGAAAEGAAASVEEVALRQPERRTEQQAREAGRREGTSGRLACWILGPLGLGMAVGLSAPRGSGCGRQTPLWQTVSSLLGWSYFFFWSLSFYPQVVQNLRRRSVAGLSLDFQLLNLAGFLCYLAFNAGLFFSADVQAEYRARHAGHSSAVELNDVVFAGHAVFATLVTLLQIFALRGTLLALDPRDRLLRRTVLASLAGLAIAAACLAAAAGVSGEGRVDWLTCLVLLSQVKVAISVVKYCPQVLLNYRRKSTDGWSIVNVLLDLLGGLLSVTQLLLDAWSCGDWSAVTGDPAKLLLGNLSMLFDTVFVVQHYVLYPRAVEQLLRASGSQRMLE